MSKLKHYYGLNHLRYLISSACPRARLFDSQSFRKYQVATLGASWRELKFQMNIRSPKERDERGRLFGKGRLAGAATRPIMGGTSRLRRLVVSDRWFLLAAASYPGGIVQRKAAEPEKQACALIILSQLD